jgi:hypothetical protein
MRMEGDSAAARASLAVIEQAGLDLFLGSGTTLMAAERTGRRFRGLEAGGGPSPEAVMGIVSLIFWALLLIVGLKYAILILRADNHGEGGIVALLALLDARHAARGSARASMPELAAINKSLK